MRHRLSVLMCVTGLIFGVLAAAPATAAVGACIGPVLKSATFTYTDDSDVIQSAGPLRYAKIRMTVSLCRDSLGNEWAAALPTFTIPSGSVGWENYVSRDTYAVTNGIRSRIHGIYYAAVGLGIRLHVRPWIQGVWTGSAWSWTKGDLGPYYMNEGGIVVHDYDPIPISSGWS